MVRAKASRTENNWQPLYRLMTEDGRRIEAELPMTKGTGVKKELLQLLPDELDCMISMWLHKEEVILNAISCKLIFKWQRCV